MKTFKKIQTLIERADTRGINSKILHMDGQITAYKDMLYHLQGLDITAAMSKCEHNMELVRHNRELLRQAMDIHQPDRPDPIWELALPKKRQG